MEAIVHHRYGGPEELSLADFPYPNRMRVLACAVNLSDWEYLTGSPIYACMVCGLRCTGAGGFQGELVILP